MKGDNLSIQNEQLVRLPYYNRDGIIIYNGDCKDIMPALRPDIVITDPPYGVNYNGSEYKNWKGQQQKWDTIKNDEGGYNLDWLFNGSYDKIIFGANYYYMNLPFTGSWIIWDKRVNEKNDKMFGNPFEMAWNSRSKLHKIYRIQHGGVVNADSTSGNNGKRVHPTQKPQKLFGKIIADFTKENELIVDPFMGSGTTLLAARKLGRKAIGIEIDKNYCDIAIDRLAQTELF